MLNGKKIKTWAKPKNKCKHTIFMALCTVELEYRVRHDEAQRDTRSQSVERYEIESHILKTICFVSYILAIDWRAYSFLLHPLRFLFASLLARRSRWISQRIWILPETTTFPPRHSTALKGDMCYRPPRQERWIVPCGKLFVNQLLYCPLVLTCTLHLGCGNLIQICFSLLWTILFCVFSSHLHRRYSRQNSSTYPAIPYGHSKTMEQINSKNI